MHSRVFSDGDLHKLCQTEKVIGKCAQHYSRSIDIWICLKVWISKVKCVKSKAWNCASAWGGVLPPAPPSNCHGYHSLLLPSLSLPSPSSSFSSWWPSSSIEDENGDHWECGWGASLFITGFNLLWHCGVKTRLVVTLKTNTKHLSTFLQTVKN